MVDILARILDSGRNFNGSADPMKTADRGFIKFLGPDFGFWLLGSSDRGSQRITGNLTFSFRPFMCQMSRSRENDLKYFSNALKRDGSVMAVTKVASYTRVDPVIFQIFDQRSNHHERVGTYRYRDRFHSVVTSCRLCICSVSWS